MHPQLPPPVQVDTWQAAEINAVTWMRYWGFADAHQTPGGADHGIDVRSQAALAQVKFEAAQVGRQAVQQLVGARGQGQQQLLFFSGTGFARTAIEYAEMMGVALFKYDLLGRQLPINSTAHQILSNAPGRDPNTLTSQPAPAWLNPTRKSLSNSAKSIIGGVFVLVSGAGGSFSMAFDDSVEDRFITALVGVALFGAIAAYLLLKGFRARASRA